MNKKIKILFIAYPNAIHTARWIMQLLDSRFEIHLFSSLICNDIHESLRNITYHVDYYTINPKNKNIKYKSINSLFFLRLKSKIIRRILWKLFRLFGIYKDEETSLKKVINKVKPDLIHSMETQHSGYLLSRIWDSEMNQKIKWIHTNWGSDLMYFSYLKSHSSNLKNTFSKIHFLISEGEKDYSNAKKFGFQGRFYKIPIATAGYSNDIINTYKEISLKERNLIIIKGYFDDVRRGILILPCLLKLKDLLNSYRIIFYYTKDSYKDHLEFFSNFYGISIEFMNNLNQKEFLNVVNHARISITNNISDGMPNSVLDAMLMGAFPIQSSNSFADQYIQNGKNGFIVDPMDIDSLTQAIKTALQDDNLILNASSTNREIIKSTFCNENITNYTLNIYKEIIS